MLETKLLLVDDEEAFVNALAKRLSIRDMKVLSAYSGEEGLAQLSREPEIDVVLLDVKMPDIDGPQTLARIRDIRPDIPAIYMTGYSDIPRDALLASGANEVVEKPFDLEQLLNLVKQYSTPTTSRRRHELQAMTRSALVAEWQSKPKFKGMTPPREVSTLVNGIIEAEECPDEESVA